MGQVTITIDKREYAITCDDGQEGNIIRLSRILDEKAKLLSRSIGLVNENMMLAMVGLLLADEIQELKKGAGLSGLSEEQLKQMDTNMAKSIDVQVEKINSLIKDVKEI